MSSGRWLLLYPSIKCGHLLPLTGHPVIPALIHSFHKNEVMVNFVKGIALMVWTQDRCCLCVFLEREQIFRAVGGQSHPSPREMGVGPQESPGASQAAWMVKNPPTNAGDTREVGTIPGSGGSPGEGHGNPLQYSCLENPMDREAWWAAVHGVTKSQTWLSTAGVTWNVV